MRGGGITLDGGRPVKSTGSPLLIPSEEREKKQGSYYLLARRFPTGFDLSPGEAFSPPVTVPGENERENSGFFGEKMRFDTWEPPRGEKKDMSTTGGRGRENLALRVRWLGESHIARLTGDLERREKKKRAFPLRRGEEEESVFGRGRIILLHGSLHRREVVILLRPRGRESSSARRGRIRFLPGAGRAEGLYS